MPAWPTSWSPNATPKPGVSSPVLDSSAVLALLLAEPGADKVMAVLPDACLSAVNAAEVVAKLCERGMPETEARAAVEGLGLDIVAFDFGQACASGGLRPATRSLGLSLGDRACLGLAIQTDAVALTTDAAWSRVAGARVAVIR